MIRVIWLLFFALALPDDLGAADLWVGKWSGAGEGSLSATIRHYPPGGTAKPDYLVIDLFTATEGCSGAVTLYGKPKGASVLGESFEPNEPDVPVCRVDLSLNEKGVLTLEVVGPCGFYHGAACSFDGAVTRVQ